MAGACPRCGFSYGWDGRACTHCKFAAVGTAVVVAEVIRFNCPRCDNRIKAPAGAAGRKGSCPSCSARVLIPAPVALAEEPVRLVVDRVAAPASPPVPIKVSLPRECGSVETQVSQQTADTLAAVAVGGLCVAAGLALAFFCPPAAAAIAAAAAGANGRNS